MTQQPIGTSRAAALPASLVSVAVVDSLALGLLLGLLPLISSGCGPPS